MRSPRKRAILGHYVYLNITPRKGGFRHRRVSARIRDRWLGHGLQTGTADRAAAEAAVRDLYHLARLSPPAFRWVPSPAAAATIIRTDRLSTAMPTTQLDHTPARIAHLIVGSRQRFEGHVELRDTAAQRSRAASTDQLRATVGQPLRTSLIDGVATAIRTLLPPSVGLLTWYGQQEAHHLAFHESLIAAGLTHPTTHDRTIHRIQADLARTTGWWWPFDDVCLMAERPTKLSAEPCACATHNEHRLHRDDRPAIEFADGSVVFAIHGTTVPQWVMSDPTVGRITSEPDADIRRCAIERLGWSDYAVGAGLSMIDEATDPAGRPLQLFDAPARRQGGGRLLVTTDRSTGPGAPQRSYFMRIPRRIASALDAAAWTVGLTAKDLRGCVHLGDLAVIPLPDSAPDVSVPRSASMVDVDAGGVRIVGDTRGRVRYSLMCETGSGRWTSNVVDRSGLARGVLQSAVPVRLTHPAHGAAVIAPGRYVIRCRRDG